MVEPYYATSHRHLVDGLVARRLFESELLTLPARKWKWRMRGGAMVLAERAASLLPCDALLASDFLDLAAFLALGPAWLRRALKVVYFHENQLTYPVRVDDERDFHFGLTNITTALAADRIAFNSRFHLEGFASAAGEMLSRFPDFRPEGVPERILARARVLPPPLDLPEFGRRESGSGPLTVLWSSRWEYDKAPEVFFETLLSLAESGLDFRVAVCGESFRDVPAVFEKARESLSGRILSWGYLESRSDYLGLLSRCDVVVSTAIHEFFGIAVAEAVAAGCVPLLPDRLAYPERYPREFLYDGRDQLRSRLREMMLDPAAVRRMDARRFVEDLDWSRRAAEFVDLVNP
jgi:glycosyltransferase involved in cell wall biosynthesis